MSSSQDKSLRVWNIKTGECVCVLKGHSGIVIYVTYINEKLVVSKGFPGDADLVRIWDVSRGKCVYSGKMLPDTYTGNLGEHFPRVQSMGEEFDFSSDKLDALGVGLSGDSQNVSVFRHHGPMGKDSGSHDVMSCIDIEKVHFLRRSS